MYEFWYYYVKLKYGKKEKLSYMNTHSFLAYIKTDDICKNIAEDVKARCDLSNYELERPLLKGKNKKVIRLKKDKLVGKIMTKFNVLRAKTYSYVIDDGSEDKKAIDTKSCVIKGKRKLTRQPKLTIK